MSSQGITRENLIQVLPSVLAKDPSIEALAETAAQALEARRAEIDRVKVIQNLDRLEEPLLDILAYDFKVDWYDYNYPIDSKRELLKGSFSVHRHMGTRGAVEQALRAIYPGTIVEEWFEYGGKPFYFRIVLDVTDARVELSNDALMRAVNLYKPLRSHLEDGGITYRSRCQIVIQTAAGYVIYTARRCGTYPQASKLGHIASGMITALTHTDGMPYTAPSTGKCSTGTHPQTATQGRIEELGVEAVTHAQGTEYTAPTVGTQPQAATLGGTETPELWLGQASGHTTHTPKPCGAGFGF